MGILFGIVRIAKLHFSELSKNDVVLRFSSERPFAFVKGEMIFAARLSSDIKELTKQLGSSSGDVLVCCKGRYAFCVAILAIWLAGRKVVLPPNLHQVTLDYISKAHNITTQLDDSFLLSSCASTDVFDKACLELVFKLKKEALIIYTSGSSGEPKAVTKTIGNLFSEAFSIKATVQNSVRPLVASVPPNHLYGLTFSIILPWVLGVAVVDECPLHAEEVLDMMAAVQADVLVTVPVHLSAMLEQDIVRVPSLVISSAGRLDEDLAKRWYERFGHEIFEVYGSTETGVIAYRQQLSDQHWQAFPHVCTDQSGDCLQVSSPFIHSSEGNMFQSNDRVSLHENGFILHGRTDAIVKIAGKRVSLLAIEKAVKTCEGIMDVAVVAVPVKGHIRDMAIWIALACEEGLTVREVRAMLYMKLDGVEIPRRIVIRKTLPREDNGKLRRSKILDLFEAKDNA